MDRQIFDALTKMLAAGTPRRLMVRGLVAWVVGKLLAGGSAAARPAENARRRKPAKRTKPTQAMVAVCHLNEEGAYDYL